jgi:tetratricopeptide (TPR) repeat protein
MFKSPEKTTKKMSSDKEILIEKYFENQLSEEENVLFKTYLTNDEDFKTTFEFEKSVKNSIHFLERDSLKSMLKGFEEQPLKKPFRLNNWLWMSVAAMVIIGLFVWLSSENQSNSQELYLSYYQSYPNVVAPVVRGENIQDEKLKAFEAYEQEKYQLASTLFHQIFNKTKEEYAIFYESQCYFSLGETQKGISLIETKIFTDEKYPFKTQQQWYLALGYLKLGEIEKAKKYLQVLINYDNIQKQKAEELLKELE